MSAEEKENKQLTYENWRAVTESDFVTLFIKTWFAFVATLREMYPHAKPYYEATGDSLFVEAYKKEFAEKFNFLCPLTVGVEQSLHSVYRAGLELISENYPRFLIKDFCDLNLSFADRIEEKFAGPGGYSGQLALSLKCTSGDSIKVTLVCTDEKFLKKVGKEQKLTELHLHYDDILDAFVEELEADPRPADESELISFFYDALFQVVFDELVEFIDGAQKVLPEKGYSQARQVYSIIQLFCRRATDSMRNTYMDSAIGAEHKLLPQIPVADFLQSYSELSASDGISAYLWFVGFVYRLRNALFHEIIDPLAPSWQLLFKNAYLVLKQIVDANISRLRTIAQLLKLAPLIVWKEFKEDPPPSIPVESNDDTEFICDKAELKRYDQSGAKVYVRSTIVCKGISYHVECNVRWDEKLNNYKVKNVVITKDGV